MNIVEIINKKRENKELSNEEIRYVIKCFLKDEIKDSQMSALLMAICLNGMDEREILDLTQSMIDSGKIMDLSSIEGVKVDKHSTGGVGDKTSLIVAPLVASCGLNVPMLSGRGLGHTGGTLDKLESIPDLNVNLTEKEFIKQVKDLGVAISSPTSEIVPADKKIYALRDITGTVASTALGVSSMMSKKIAAGADKIVFDVKVGKGAFFKNIEDATKFAEMLNKIGKHYNKETISLLTDMDNPLGNSIGNSLEILEAYSLLSEAEGNQRLLDLCIIIASYMVSMGKNISYEEAKNEVILNLRNKKAFFKFLNMVVYQKGEILRPKVSQNYVDVKSLDEGYVTSIDAYKIGQLAMELGGGRKYINDTIDHSVGIYLYKHVGDYVKEKEILARLYLKDKNYDINDLYEAYYISNQKPEEKPLVYKIVK